jgi:hypothetical protein
MHSRKLSKRVSVWRKHKKDPDNPRRRRGLEDNMSEKVTLEMHEKHYAAEDMVCIVCGKTTQGIRFKIQASSIELCYSCVFRAVNLMLATITVRPKTTEEK